MSDYTVIIIVTLVGFLGLAALLLVPVYRFLKREEKVSRKWTERQLRKRPSDEYGIPGPQHDTPGSENGTEKRDGDTDR